MSVKNWAIEFGEGFHSFKCPKCNHIDKIKSYLPIKVSLLECSNCSYIDKSDDRHV